MKPDYIQGEWFCESNCKKLIALNVVHCEDGTFRCLYCYKQAKYKAQRDITPEQFRKRFGDVPHKYVHV